MEHLKYSLDISLDHSLHSLSDKLYQVILVMNELIRSNNSSHQYLKKDFSSPSSPMRIDMKERIRRLISSTPAISSSMIDPITTKRSKVSTHFSSINERKNLSFSLFSSDVYSVKNHSMTITMVSCTNSYVSHHLILVFHRFICSI